MEINYKQKYLKYKNKYFELKQILGGNKTSIKLSEELGSKRGERFSNAVDIAQYIPPFAAGIAAYNATKLATLGTLTAA
jgi:hypothetical protein